MLCGSCSTGSSATCRERESMIWSGQSRPRCCSCSTTATAAARPERAASTKSYSSTSMAPTTAFSVLRTDSSLIQLNRQLKIQLPPSWIMGLVAKSRTEEGGGFTEAQLQELREIKSKKDSGQCNVLASMLWMQWKIVRTINESMNKLTSQCKSIWWSLYCPVLL